MDSKNILYQFIDKSDKSASEKEALKTKIADLPTVELPDEIITIADGFYTKDSAKANKDVGDHFRTKLDEEDRKILRSKLTADGFTEEEIQDILKASKEERISKVSKNIENKLQNKYSLSQSEKDAIYEKQIEDLKKQLDLRNTKIREMATSAEAIARDVERKAELKYLVGSLPFAKGQNVLPKEKAIKMLMEEVENKLSLEGRNIVFNKGYAELVDRDDESTLVYDDRSNVVDATRYIRDVASSLNLLEINQSNIKDMPKSTQRVVSTNQSQNSSTYNVSNKIKTLFNKIK